MSSKQFTVSCSCSAITHTFHVPLSALPLSSRLCNCDISRRISGSLLTSYIKITHYPDEPGPDTSALTAYENSDILRRWFCARCGTHMFLEYHSDGHFEAATGTLEGDQSDGIVKFESLMWIGDARDQGASSFVTHIDGKKLTRWAGKAGSIKKPPTCRSGAQVNLERGEAVYAHCHCRGVEFWVTLPEPSQRDHETTKSPFPDLIVPHRSHDERSYNPDNEPWWSPNGTRWRAGTCACASCRKASGFDITFWAFIPTANIFLDAACTKSFSAGGEYWGTMKTYSSSKGVTRTFCKTCGANVFWDGDEENFGRKGLVDVAVGLLDAQSGARAEEMLDWWCGRVSFAEDAIHKGLVEGLEQGLKDWEYRSLGRNGTASRQ